MAKNNRRHGIFAVPAEVKSVDLMKEKEEDKHIKIADALETVFNQMRVGGNRERTIESYKYIFNQFVAMTKVYYVEDITLNTIYKYLEVLDVANETKLIRLKSIKAVLSRFFNNGWIKSKFWTGIQIKIDRKVKTGTTKEEIEKLIQLIDTTTFIGLRDVTAILTMYKTGIRIRTLGELKESYIDFTNLYLDIDGSALKNHKNLKLPIDRELADLYKVLIGMNKGIREYYGTNNDNVFISQNGRTINNNKSSSNAIAKQLNKYSKRFGLQNVKAHALRRAYAKNLLDGGASVALISKALGHSSLDVTTQYLDLDVDEVANNLRDYL